MVLKNIGTRFHPQIMGFAILAGELIDEIRGAGGDREESIVDVRCVGRVTVDLRGIFIFHRNHEHMFQNRRLLCAICLGLRRTVADCPDVVFDSPRAVDGHDLAIGIETAKPSQCLHAA
jgi:hypothetical protein